MFPLYAKLKLSLRSKDLKLALMPKIVLLVSFLIVVSAIYLISLPQKVYAVPPLICPVAKIEVEPANQPLTNKSETARFFIDVSQIGGGTKAYDGWSVEFQCSPIFKYEANAQIEDDYTISIMRGNIPTLTGTPCEFEAGRGKVMWVKGITRGQKQEICTAAYEVKDNDAFCKLETHLPASNITSTSSLTAKGSNLTKGGRFVLFFDDTGIDLPVGGTLLITPAAGNVQTPSFTKQIPQNLLSPGFHTISLRAFARPAPTIENTYGPRLCPIDIIVKPPPATTTKTPGANAPSKAAGSTTSLCPVGKIGGAGCSCEIILGGDRYGGLATAVGCVPTQPVGLVRALLQLMLSIGGGIAFLIMLMGVFQMITSAGNADSLKAGTDRLTSAIIGILFLVFSILILQIIGFGILNIPGFG